MENPIENKENPLFGAEKRKSYKRKFNETREATPADSGFKEPSETSHPLTTISVPSSTAGNIIENQNHSTRTSKRKKIASRKNFAAIQDDDILKTFLITKRFVRAREHIQKTMSRWKLKVVLTRMSPSEVIKLSNDWRFLGHLKIPNTLKFRCEILAQRKALNTLEQTFFVKWLPSGIIEDCWISERNLPKDGIMVINIQNMNWKQKMLVRGKLLVKR